VELVNARLLQWVVACPLEHDRLDGYLGDALEEELAAKVGVSEGREGERERRGGKG
jgi:hypothetical protein